MQFTNRQEAILTWLRKVYPSAADLFVSALTVAMTPDIPCKVRLMAHAFREVCITINNEYSSNSRVDMKPRMVAMVTEYQQLSYQVPALSASVSPEPEAPMIEVPHTFMRSVAEVVDCHALQSKAARDRARQAFESMSRGASGAVIDVVPIADRWHKMYDYFAGRAHAPTADSGGTDAAELDREIQFFEQTLESLAKPAIPNLDALDAILEDANA